MSRYVMVIDTRRCVGCMDCVVACKTENNVPEGYNRDWITEEVRGAYPNPRLEIRSERCNHCANPPCVSCCPTGASHVRKGSLPRDPPDSTHQIAAAAGPRPAGASAASTRAGSTS